MDTFINIIKIKVKNGSKKDYINKIKYTTDFEGLVSTKHVALNSNTYFVIEEWTSKKALTKARETIENFDKMSNFVKLVEENPSEIEIIDSLGGPIIVKKDEKEKDQKHNNFFRFLKSFMKIH